MKYWMMVGAALALTGCAHQQETADIVLVEAAHELLGAPEAEVVPMQIVEIPKAIPFPNQLKPLPELSVPKTAVVPAEAIREANAESRIEPTPSGFINAIQVWPFTPGGLYQVYTAEGKGTDIALEPGEALIDISIHDPVRWIIGDTRSGEGATERQHLVVKPVRADLETNLFIFTNRRTYHLELKSTQETWMAGVSWQYPEDRAIALKARQQARMEAQPLAVGIALENLRFRYAITGDEASWRPVRAFDDGRKVYIQFPESAGHGEMPPLFVLGAKGDAQLVNYRVRSPYYIVDRVFAAAELRLGGENAEVVRIERTDAQGRKGRR